MDITFDPRTVGVESTYTYAAGPDVRAGDAFIVPLGSRQLMGYALRVYEADEDILGFPVSALKPPESAVRGLGLPAPLVELARYMADEYLCRPAVALGPALPPGAKDRLVNAWEATGEPPGKLPALQTETLKVILEADGPFLERRGKKLEPPFARALKALRQRGLVRRYATLSPAREARSRERLLALTADEGRVEAFLRGDGKKKPAQALVLILMQSAPQAAFEALEIKAMAGVTEATLNALRSSELLVEATVESIKKSKAPSPNPYQSLAINAITQAVSDREGRGFLLFGVTGSGKTEVYLQAAAEALEQGRQVLYLVPEIALAAQAISQLRARFGKAVAVLHSELTPVERLQNWVRIRTGEASVVVGARSAVFAPLDNLGLIVMDEEHEASYKQESSPRYHAKRLVSFLASQHGCPFVLGSATPSVESFYETELEPTNPILFLPPGTPPRDDMLAPTLSQEVAASTKALTLISLPERAASAKLPDVEIDDLTIGYKTNNPALIAPALEKALGETITKGEQAILFLNRRAYAPFLMCRDCGERIDCPHCAVSLSFHRNLKLLRCHHCGFQMTPPDVCPKCESTRLNPFGVGTEKVEETVREMFEGVRVARLDRDVVQKAGVLEATLSAFRAGDIDVLVGTQMVAKGLDFPRVTLVGVIAADLSLNIPDFRAAERTYQLLSQVAGRAGRGTLPGRVIIQTFNPTHVAVLAAQKHEYLPMYELVCAERRDAEYPPFRRLINIIFNGEDRPAVTKASQEAAALLLLEGLDVRGPADCPLERLQGRWRRHLLVKLPREGSVTRVGVALRDFSRAGVSVTIDVDAYSLM
jgi:primosomal protein N' (replication factor Y)